MKKNPFIIAAALSAFLSAGCTKEPISPNPSEAIHHNEEAIVYSIDGNYSSTNEKLELLMDFLFSLVDEGHEVTAALSNTTTSPTKAREVITFTTSDRQEAQAWMTRMIQNGYSVTSTYNERTQCYECVARK